eukprot:338018-Chlamydomonas_euryale.AAC.2
MRKRLQQAVGSMQNWPLNCHTSFLGRAAAGACFGCPWVAVTCGVAAACGEAVACRLAVWCMECG